MQNKIRTAFIGVGIMGTDLLKEFVKNPEAEVVALCDTDSVVLNNAAALCSSSPKLFADYRQMLSEVKPDAVVNATPQDLHASISIETLDTGCHTFCEKPMALNVVDCEAMIAAARRNGKILMIGQVLQYMGAFRYVLEAARSGVYGKAFAMRNMRTQGIHWGSTWDRPWRRRRDQCGGLLPEVNVHEIDLMCRILGKPVAVTALGNRFINQENDYEDFSTLQIEFENGGIGSVTSGCCDYLGKNSSEIFMEQATFYIDGFTREVNIGKADGSRETLPIGEIHPEWENGYYRELREFITACRGEGPVTIPGEEGMRALEVAQAACISITEHRRIELPMPR